MSEHVGYVVKINLLRPHSNADRLQIATIFDSNVIVSLDTHLDDIGVYFPSDIQLSEEFCKVNDLVRRKDENGNPAGGYLDPNKRNIRPLKLRGEKSDGLYLPITCMMEFCPISDLKVGDTIGVVNGHEICKKYIPYRTKAYHYTEKVRKQKVNFAPTFFEHCDTAQLAYNLEAFRAGDVVELTLKMHGTSARMGYLPLLQPRTLLDKILRRTRKTYGNVIGTRRVVLDETHTGGFYEDNAFRRHIAKKVEGKLHRGETIYGEIVGFQGPNGAPIMSSVKNSKISDKAFTKQYGEETVFSYDCNAANGYEDEHPCCELYVYRMTMVNDDGDVVDYSPAQIRYRCEQMGVKVVPQFEVFVIPQDEPHPGEYVVRKVEEYYDGPDPIGKTHVREGVVARILNRNNFAVYKMKNWSFKCLEGIVKDEAAEPDMEEVQEELVEEQTE